MCRCKSTNCDLRQRGEVAGWDEQEEGAGDTLLALQFNHYICGEVLTVVLWKPLKLLSKVK